MIASEHCTFRASQVALVVKSPPANAGNLGDAGLTPGSGRSPGRPLEEDMATHSSITAWRIPWIEEPWIEGHSPQGRKESDTTELT